MRRFPKCGEASEESSVDVVSGQSEIDVGVLNVIDLPSSDTGIWVVKSDGSVLPINVRITGKVFYGSMDIGSRFGGLGMSINGDVTNGLLLPSVEEINRAAKANAELTRGDVIVYTRGSLNAAPLFCSREPRDYNTRMIRGRTRAGCYVAVSGVEHIDYAPYAGLAEQYCFKHAVYSVDATRVVSSSRGNFSLGATGLSGGLYCLGNLNEHWWDNRSGCIPIYVN
jgi:hypothetical protein